MNHPQQQEAQSITVKPDTASVSANRASAGNRSNQKLTEVSSELEPQQQESWRKRFRQQFFIDFASAEKGWSMRHIDEIEAFISTERQRVLDEVRELVEGKKRDVRLKDGCGFCKSTDEKPCNCDPWNSALDDLLSAIKEIEAK